MPCCLECTSVMSGLPTQIIYSFEVLLLLTSFGLSAFISLKNWA